MKTYMAKKAIKNMVLSFIVLMPLQINSVFLPANGLDYNMQQEEVPVSAQPKVILLDLEKKYCDISCFLNEKKDTLEFLSKTFAIDYKYVYEDLLEINKDQKYDEFNIGALKDKEGNYKSYSSFEKGLIEYFFDFAKRNPSLVSNTRVPYNGEPTYVINLIKYFTSIYTNVDYTTAVSIGAAESGNYTVKYMLNCNNVYGGMSNSGLIKYKNIEYGVLSFIRLLSYNYYGNGLTTIEDIGRVYCPVYDSNGNKIASPHWINLVKSLTNKYKDSYTEVTVANLLND